MLSHLSIKDEIASLYTDLGCLVSELDDIETLIWWKEGYDVIDMEVQYVKHDIQHYKSKIYYMRYKWPEVVAYELAHMFGLEGELKRKLVDMVVQGLNEELRGLEDYIRQADNLMSLLDQVLELVKEGNYDSAFKLMRSRVMSAYGTLTHALEQTRDAAIRVLDQIIASKLLSEEQEYMLERLIMYI